MSHQFEMKINFNLILQFLFGGILLSIFGFIAGRLLAFLFKQEYEDRIAIGCETTIQNIST